MTLVRLDPFRELTNLQSHLNRVFSETPRSEAPVDSWAPVVDIFERGDDLVLHAEIPGVDANEIELQVEGRVLTLRGERTRHKEVKEEDYHRVERTYGSFSRTFTLPSGVDPSRIAASSKDGVLEVVLPKAEEAKPKRIEVKAS